jgi:hypothetical protein
MNHVALKNLITIDDRVLYEAFGLKKLATLFAQKI